MKRLIASVIMVALVLALSVTALGEDLDIFYTQSKHGKADQIEQRRIYGQRAPQQSCPENESQRNRRDRLCRHTRRVIETGESSDLAGGAQLHHHGKRAAVDKCHSESLDHKDQKENRWKCKLTVRAHHDTRGRYKAGGGDRHCSQRKAQCDRPLSADPVRR